jgi:ankyrin repeat protein
MHHHHEISAFCRFFLIASALLAIQPISAQQSVTAETYQKLGQAVFEVVVPKQDDSDTFSYAEPLPRELLSYLDRTDPYSSIGTAFCVGSNRFVSAAHVFALEEESVNTEFFLRDSEGKVYQVDTVSKYANHQDCIFFSVKDPPDITPLEEADAPKINTRVFTVGNAYGQGVIVRDGVLTSMTPEERDGAWKWLRFSAAASPGNSGGPLVDIDGKVLGITIARSENENFNLALPIQIADALPNGVAKLNKQAKYGIPIFSYVAQSRETAEVSLPRPISELKRLLVAERNRLSGKTLDDLLAEQKDKTFPEAKGSDYLLRNPMVSFMPGVACEQSDYSWKLSYPEKTQQVQLTDGCKLDFGTWSDYTFQYFTFAPDISGTDILYSDPVKAMDDVLTGYSLTRSMAGKNIRITSLGKPVSTEKQTDRFGRVWQLTQWNAAFADWAIVWLRLPTPNGFIGIMRSCPMWDRQAIVNDLREIVDLLDVDYSGSIDQWTAFLKRADAPASLRAFEIEYGPDKKLRLNTPDFRVKPDTANFPVDGKTIVNCYLTWTKNADGKLSRSINALYLKNPGKESDGIIVSRVTKPGFMDTPERAASWKAVATGTAPFDGNPGTANGGTSVCAAFALAPYVNGACDPDTFPAAYIVQLMTDAKTPNDDAKKAFESLMSSIRITEAGISGATGIADEGLNATKILRDIKGMTIFEAIAADNAEILGEFISRNINLDAVDGQKRTPLEAAILERKPASAMMLAKAATGPEKADDEGTTPLMLALQYDNPQVASELIAHGADPNRQSKDKWTPLMYALRYSSPEAAMALLKVGAKPDGVNQNKWTPLMFALRYSTPEVCTALIGAGAQTDGSNVSGWTSLMFALRYSTPEVADALIDKSPDISARDSDGWNALMYALSNNMPKQANRLLSAGADCTTPDQKGWTPLMFALKAGLDDQARTIIDKGASLTCVDNEEWTPLMYALRYASEDISCEIIRKGGQTSKVNKDGWTDLLFALRYKKPSAARLLIDRGASMDTRNSDGFTPLLMATKYSTASLVKALIDKGADTSAATKDNETSLDLARALSEKDKIELLSAAAEKKAAR